MSIGKYTRKLTVITCKKCNSIRHIIPAIAWKTFYCKKCQKEIDKKRDILRANQWNKKNRERRKEIQYKNRDNKRFNGNRLLCLKRDKFMCKLCHSKDKLIVHHKKIDTKISERIYLEANLNDLVTLCISCHIKIHRYILI